jgi:hypothetical protein
VGGLLPEAVANPFAWSLLQSLISNYNLSLTTTSNLVSMNLSDHTFSHESASPNHYSSLRTISSATLLVALQGASINFGMPGM